jgi:hypothetical protein
MGETMRGLIIVMGVIAFITSCASTRSNNKVTHTDVTFTDGVYKDKEWDEDLDFYRTSWYKGATLTYDLLLAKVDKNSAYANWLESSKESYGKKCKEFYIAMLYSGDQEPTSIAKIKSGITNSGFKEVSVAQFKAHISSSYVFEQWHLQRHKLVGYCYEGIGSPEDFINITLPGFKEENVLPKR